MKNMFRNEAVSIEIHVPFKFVRQRKSCRTEIICDDIQKAQESNFNIALVKALTKAWYWNNKIINGSAFSFEEIAYQEEISSTYVGKISRLNYLAPEIVTAIVQGRQPKSLLLTDLMGNFPDIWEEQLLHFKFKEE